MTKITYTLYPEFHPTAFVRGCPAYVCRKWAVFKCRNRRRPGEAYCPTHMPRRSP